MFSFLADILSIFISRHIFNSNLHDFNFNYFQNKHCKGFINIQMCYLMYIETIIVTVLIRIVAVKSNRNSTNTLNEPLKWQQHNPTVGQVASVALHLISEP